MVKVYRGFPRRLHHSVPSWVESGAIFHVRIASDRVTQEVALTTPKLAKAILESVQAYEEQFRWYIRIFVLMPDHLHMLVSFAADKSMSSVVGDWKRFHARKNHVVWQEGYFDHRLRNDERSEQLSAKVEYIRRNPVAAGLGSKTGHGFTRPWAAQGKVDRALRSSMVIGAAQPHFI